MGTVRFELWLWYVRQRRKGDSLRTACADCISNANRYQLQIIADPVPGLFMPSCADGRMQLSGDISYAEPDTLQPLHPLFSGGAPMTDSNIESILEEDRKFAPPQAFVENANLKPAD